MKKRKYKKLKQEYKILAESYLDLYQEFKLLKEKYQSQQNTINKLAQEKKYIKSR
ncbi:hypothetical protein [Francisella philomiragia]|uniref:Uncharacterized protein n=1 Tax=Francisella philomiragia TaxID=28110 RepID=A0ABS1GEN5_9GAMM|nr:hypothetical protein [Francisella philomiragia]MBK2259598.1 hypothetical protein [Francisella philomiragia]MBK2303291.1 hypothetical protein [Francisella philomiragia]